MDSEPNKTSPLNADTPPAGPPANTSTEDPGLTQTSGTGAEYKLTIPLAGVDYEVAFTPEQWTRLSLLIAPKPVPDDFTKK